MILKVQIKVMLRSLGVRFVHPVNGCSHDMNTGVYRTKKSVQMVVLGDLKY